MKNQNNPMPSLIDKLTELHSKATQGEWKLTTGEEEYMVSSNNDGERSAMFWDDKYGKSCCPPDLNDVEYIVALHSAFPLIKQHFEATEKLVEAMKHIAESPSYDFWDYGEMFELVVTRSDAALAEYWEAIKE